jgi:hypothetical protein
VESATPQPANAPSGAPAAEWTTTPPAKPALWRNRLIALCILLPAVAVLGVAARLTPDASGMGTHEQLGLNACSTLAVTGYPCPTCGMTTAFAHAAHGQFLASFHAQPAGALLALITACAVLISTYALVFGVNLDRLIASCWAPRPLLMLGLIVALGWIYKIIVVRGFL